MVVEAVGWASRKCRISRWPSFVAEIRGVEPWLQAMLGSDPLSISSFRIETWSSSLA
jgi:hypothetical protein